MEYLWFAFAGVLAGVLGGMGMGGGTLLIPLLNIFYNVGQHSAQTLNLISFIPMALVALIIHFKNKLICYHNVLFIIIPGILTCVGGCYIANLLSGDILGRCFGGFLIILAVVQLIAELKKKKE